MQDVAREVGVTAAAVSLALKNDPSISKARREEIQAVAERLGYRLNPIAAALAHHRHESRTHPVQAALAFINSHSDPAKIHAQPDFELCWRSAMKSADKFGYRLEEFVVNEKQPLKRLERIFLTRNIRGIIIAPLESEDSRVDWESFDWDKFCTVRIGRRRQTPHVHFVTNAQAANTMLAFDKIRERGYMRPAFAGYWDKSRMFGAGFLWAQNDPSLQSRVPPFLFSRGTPELSQQHTFEEWLQDAKPDAILTDSLAVPSMLKRAGYRVPEDIALAATNVGAIPAVTAGIDQNTEELGRVSVLVLISLLQDNATGIPPIRREILIQGSWQEGDTLPWRK